MILVGTSGFQYCDWVPVFYPRNLDAGSFMNNPWHGQAVINARMLIDDLRLTNRKSSIVN